jgi:hypothetical protein
MMWQRKRSLIEGRLHLAVLRKVSERAIHKMESIAVSRNVEQPRG